MHIVPKNPYSIFTVFMMALIGCAIFSADTGFAYGPISLVQQIPYGDKWAHAILYGSLAYGLGRSFLHGQGFLGLQRAVVWVALFGLAEELSQFWFPLRTVDMGDLLADLLGLGCAQLALHARTVKPRLH